MGRKRVAAGLLAAAWAGGAFAADAADATRADGLTWREEMQLLAPDSDAEVRGAAMARAQARAGEGYADAAFLLGALYRSGPAHPAAALPRDAALARRWLERCVDSEHCTPFAFGSLAELELAEGDARRAMQWAQIALIFEREIGRELSPEGKPPSGYLPGLLKRVFAALPEPQRADEEIERLLKEMLAQRGGLFDRMLNREIAAAKRAPDSSHPWPLKDKPKPMSWRGRRPPSEELLGLYALEVPAAGGRASRVAIIEGLPRPRDARGLDRIAAAVEFAPWQPAEGFGGAWQPVMFDTRRYTLKAE